VALLAGECGRQFGNDGARLGQLGSLFLFVNA
jgi:hypothetical protein